MKAIILSIVVLFFASVYADIECHHKEAQVPKEWIDIKQTCVSKMRNQIQKELSAAMQYMAMGAWFSKDNVHKPGFAKLFFESASEEREHAMKLIDYLLMRGELKSEVSNLISNAVRESIKTTKWASGEAALKEALKLEAEVTKSIRDVIISCEQGDNFNDYHLVDYLTGDFLEEQYKGQREIAGRISTLNKLKNDHGALGEFIFDKKLLSAE